MRVTTAFKRLLRLDDVNVVAVEFLTTIVIVTVALRRRRLVCPHCGFKTRFRYDTRPAPSWWRHLDLGTWRLEVRASLRRLRCPDHGVVVEAVPFARPGANLTRDLDDLLAWLATRMDGPHGGAIVPGSAPFPSDSWRPAYLKSVKAEGHAPQAIVCADPFHLVCLVGDALDEVRRDLWNQLRRLPDDRWAKDFKGARWALLKDPEDLTSTQAAQLKRIRRNRGGMWRAYEMKEQFRAILAGDLTRDEAGELLDRWCARAQRSRPAPFVKVAKTMRQRREMILNAVEHGISNGRVEGFNTKLRLPPHHPQGVRVPFRRRGPGPRHARCRAHRHQAAARAGGLERGVLIHIVVRRAGFRRSRRPRSEHDQTAGHLQSSTRSAARPRRRRDWRR